MCMGERGVMAYLYSGRRLVKIICTVYGCIFVLGGGGEVTISTYCILFGMGGGEGVV